MTRSVQSPFPRSEYASRDRASQSIDGASWLVMGRNRSCGGRPGVIVSRTAADVASEAAIEAFIKDNNNLNGDSATTTVEADVDAPVTFSAFKASATLPRAPAPPVP